MKVLITGGSGFIGTSLTKFLLENTAHEIVNVDCLTYAGNFSESREFQKSSRYKFEKLDVRARVGLRQVFQKHQPDSIIHLAAESHVDRSIAKPDNFVETNILGTFTLLEVFRDYWEKLPLEKKDNFRLVHVSTDEVYGDLDPEDIPTKEGAVYRPSSPYSASKAAADQLVRAWGRTYSLPVIVTHSSNNYGPYQFPEKLIPKVILNAISGQAIPIYGSGRQIRDWIFVEDHLRGLCAVLERGIAGENYHIGARNERTNLAVVTMICDLLENFAPNRKIEDLEFYRDLIRLVDDRPGHDFRYSIDVEKIEKELGWIAESDFESALKKTVYWYLKNESWWNEIITGDYQPERFDRS